MCFPSLFSFTQPRQLWPNHSQVELSHRSIIGVAISSIFLIIVTYLPTEVTAWLYPCLLFVYCWPTPLYSPYWHIFYCKGVSTNQQHSPWPVRYLPCMVSLTLQKSTCLLTTFKVHFGLGCVLGLLLLGGLSLLLTVYDIFFHWKGVSANWQLDRLSYLASVDAHHPLYRPWTSSIDFHPFLSRHQCSNQCNPQFTKLDKFIFVLLIIPRALMAAKRSTY